MIFSDTKSFKSAILEKCDERSDVGANAVRIRFLVALYVTSSSQMRNTTNTVITCNNRSFMQERNVTLQMIWMKVSTFDRLN